MNEIKNRLIAARALIASPKNWTKKEEARDKIGQPVPYLSEKADSYCIVGALSRVGVHGPTALFAALGCLEGLNFGLVAFNDDPATYHCAVLSLFDRAIENCDKPNNLNPKYFLE